MPRKYRRIREGRHKRAAPRRARVRARPSDVPSKTMVSIDDALAAPVHHNTHVPLLHMCVEQSTTTGMLLVAGPCDVDTVRSMAKWAGGRRVHHATGNLAFAARGIRKCAHTTLGLLVITERPEIVLTGLEELLVPGTYIVAPSPVFARVFSWCLQYGIALHAISRTRKADYIAVMVAGRAGHDQDTIGEQNAEV
jgi:hypothetical protein